MSKGLLQALHKELGELLGSVQTLVALLNPTHNATVRHAEVLLCLNGSFIRTRACDIADSMVFQRSYKLALL